MTEIENKYATITLSNNIIVGEYKEVEIDLEAAKLIVKDRKTVANYVNYPLLVTGSMKKITKEARDYFASKEGSELLSAAALHTDSNFTMYLANFVLKINFKKANIPIKVFSNKQEAINWLKTFHEN